MQGLRLCLCSIVTTMHSGEAWDVYVPLLLSLLVLIRKSYSVHFCTFLCMCSFFLHPHRTHAFEESTVFCFLWYGHCAVFTSLTFPVVFELTHWSVIWTFHMVSVMETLFQMRLHMDKMCVIDVIRLCKCKVLTLCCIFFLILRNSQMC